jgi:hypothetical protein
MKSSKIPIVWERFFKEAETEHNSALQRYDKKQTEYRTKMRAWEKGTRKSDPPTAPLKPVPRMQAGEQINFLRFATALKIFVSSSISTQGINRAENLYREYLLNYLEVC